MSTRLSQSFISDLLARVDIIEIIGNRIALRKAGANYEALCPFHTEKTPSFKVSASKQLYYCFGCNAHGTVLSFLMNYDRLDFREAIEVLAQLTGLTIPDDIKKTNNNPEYDALYYLLQRVSVFYQAQLRQSKFAIDYLKNRGLTGEIAKRYAIGYVPNGWENLTKHFGRDSNLINQLIISGMLIKKNVHQTYDRFHSRIMFPIRDVRGRVIGFGGRTLTNEIPKYLNSPETPIFHKSFELYGLYEALQICKKLDRLIIVEGYMDVIALAQYGISNVVATLGTAIGERHLHKLLRYAKEIIFCFDGDTAGQHAAWRALEITLPMMRDGIYVSFVFLPQSDDPDSFIRARGKSTFEKLLSEAQPLSEFFFQHLSLGINIQTTDGKAKFASLAKNYIEKLPHGIFKQLMLEKLTQYVGTTIPIKENRLPAPSVPASLKIPILSAFKSAILLLLQAPELSKDVPNYDFLKLFNNFEAQTLYQILEILKDNPHLPTGALIEYWRGEEVASYLAKLAAYDYPAPREGLKVEFLGAMKRILEQSRGQLIQVLLDKAKKQPLEDQEKRQLQQLIAESQTDRL